jgi:serine protease
VQEVFKGLGTGGELWSGVMTQYCQGVAVGATSCLNTNAHVGYPSGGALAGVYYDNQSIPTTTTKDQIAAEAYSAAKLFGNLTRDAQYVILSPTGSHPDGFNGSWCAWHLATSSSYGSIAFTNLPYVMDYSLFGACGAGQVPGSATPALDGYTITASHEYAETLTDPLPNFEPAWFNPAVGVDSGENADECHDSAAEVATATGTFALTATWSNDTGGCATSHAILPILTNVPDLIGDTLSQAGQALNAAGLVMGTKSYKVDCNNIGLVAAQNPAPGTRVVAGTYVSITIGTKPTWPAVCP